MRLGGIYALKLYAPVSSLFDEYILCKTCTQRKTHQIVNPNSKRFDAQGLKMWSAKVLRSVNVSVPLHPAAMTQQLAATLHHILMQA
jgi:hypothetical protein